jgi:hypothetical protein
VGAALGVRAGVALAAASALWGCFDPNVDGAVCMTCTDECPGDLACRNGYCMAPDSTTQCSQSGAGGTSGAGNDAGRANAAGSGGTTQNGGSGGAGDHGAGRGGAAGAARGGSGGSPHTGGSSGVAGHSGGSTALGGADDGGTGGGCAITADVTPACSGQEFIAELTLPCGSAPFHWRITHGGDGLVLDAHGRKATLSGTFADAGDYPATVSVTDANGLAEETDLRLHVRDTPVVTTASLPSVCENERYALPLSAEGGDGEHYDWSSDVPAESGLIVSDGKLGGLFTPTGTSSLAVTFTVESGGCVSVPVTLPLDRAAPAQCPQIVAANATGQLPAPCSGNDYALDLTVVGPSGSYTWQELAAPAGLQFDAGTQHLSGTPTAPGALTLAVAGAGHDIEQTFDLEPRDTCWLAYLGSVGGVTRLGLFDPVTQVSRSTPSDPNADPVLDFKFSPDGRFLAYRTGASAGAGQLTLVEMPSRVEHALSFEQVSHYAWSADSSALAVGFSDAGGPELGGVDVLHPQTNASVTTYPELTPLAASVDSELAWYGGDHVAFLSARAESLWPLHAATLAGGGFTDPLNSDTDFGSASELRSGASGVFVIPSDNAPIVFYGLDFFGDPNEFPDSQGTTFLGVPHANLPISGTGRYLAGADGALSVFAAGNPSAPDFGPVPDATANGCEAVLAWASGSERVACGLGTGSDNQAQVVLFDVTGDAGGTAISAPLAVNGVSGFPDTFPSGRQRLFARDGRYFAFTTDTKLSVARLGVANWSVVLDFDYLPAPGADDAVVAFAPTGTAVATHRGNRLSLFRLDDPTGIEILLSSELPLSNACQDSARAAAGSSCGAERENTAFAWSPDGTTLAHATAAGELWYADLTLAYGHDRVSATCGACLSGHDFAFQP